MNKTLFTNHLIFPVTVMVLMFCLSGCISSTKTWKPVQARHKLMVHIVQCPEETLPMIAKWYTDSSQNWKKLANANPNIVVGHLFTGDRILLPSQLLKTSKEMPQQFIKTFLAPTSPLPTITTPSKRAPADHEEDEFELFGPK